MLLGSGISNGVGFSRAVILKRKELSLSNSGTSDTKKELERVDSCVKQTCDELKNVYNNMSNKVIALNLADKYIRTINNPGLIRDIKEKIMLEETSAEHAVTDIMENFKRVVKELDDEYLCEKCEDIEEIKLRLLAKLTGDNFTGFENINRECIIVADHLTPGEVLGMDPEYVKGIVTISVGPSSSSGIMARYANIPAVMGVGFEGTYIKNGDLLIVDGNKGMILVNPDEDELSTYGISISY